MKVLPFKRKRKPLADGRDKGADIIPFPVVRKRWCPSLVETAIKACERADARESRTGREIADEDILKDIDRRRNPPGNDDEPDPAA
jgi:hypothetical protein